MRKQFSAALAALVLGVLLATSGSALAQEDDDAGYNSSDTDSVTIGSDPETGGATQEDEDAMESIQEQMDELKDSQSGDSADSDESDDSADE